MKKNWLITNFLLMFIIVISAISILPNFHSSANSFIVQKTAANTAGTIANSGTTSTIMVTAGNSLIIVAGFASGNSANTVLQCSDNLAQSWTTAVQENNNPNSGQAITSIICYKTNTIGGAEAFTVTASTVAQGLIVIAGYEVTPALSFSGIEISDICSNGVLGNCIAANSPGALTSSVSPFGWKIGGSNASLVLSVLGGSPTGVNNAITATGFDVIDTTNVPAPGNSNHSQAIAEGSGLYAVALTNNYNSGVSAYFGPFSVSTTVTSTITGFLVPNFVNGVSSLSWLYFLIVVLVPMAEIIGVVTMDRASVLDRHAMIFIFLSLLLLDSIFGVMLNVVTVAMPFIFGILFGVYLWRGRG